VAPLDGRAPGCLSGSPQWAQLVKALAAAAAEGSTSSARQVAQGGQIGRHQAWT